ncbi:hypothetical protein OE88DRAFT_759733 [Heliocybe sulcata]|uniref:Uncharacterized protein n=1 Tax=Heliocybe sulcata TaxID=5364 RepID=A0A5C3MS84_9AGAM|nr:hypothetical protein OE88DRAFT_759733 [Heliocybe sulcata]
MLVDVTSRPHITIHSNPSGTSRSDTCSVQLAYSLCHVHLQNSYTLVVLYEASHCPPAARLSFALAPFPTSSLAIENVHLECALQQLVGPRRVGGAVCAGEAGATGYSSGGWSGIEQV